jgi:hypothetical protein
MKAIAALLLSVIPCVAQIVLPSVLVVDGKEYTDVSYQSHDAARMKIKHADGVASIDIGKLSPEMQAALGYDPEAAKLDAAAPAPPAPPKSAAQAPADPVAQSAPTPHPAIALSQERAKRRAEAAKKIAELEKRVAELNVAIKRGGGGNSSPENKRRIAEKSALLIEIRALQTGANPN